jgi:hypothetical protein
LRSSASGLASRSSSHSNLNPPVGLTIPIVIACAGASANRPAAVSRPRRVAGPACAAGPVPCYTPLDESLRRHGPAVLRDHFQHQRPGVQRPGKRLLNQIPVDAAIARQVMVSSRRPATQASPSTLASRLKGGCCRRSAICRVRRSTWRRSASHAALRVSSESEGVTTTGATA